MATSKHKADGSSTEKHSVSLQGGGQTEARYTAARVTSAKHSGFQANLELTSVRVGGGVHNPDGSKGANVGAAMCVVSVGAKYEDHTSMMSVDVGACAGVDVALGSTENLTCARASVGLVTVNVCGANAPTLEASPENGTRGASSRTNDGSGGAPGR